jgi:acetyl-CoA synthetase
MDLEQHWTEVGNRLNWIKPWTKLSRVSFHKPVSIEWYIGGKLNAAYNCLDRHLEKKSDKTALIWVADDPFTQIERISFAELHLRVVEMAEVLLDLGIKKGDRITLYLPMIPAAVVAMLASARIGAIHNVVFAGFAPDALASRIEDSQSNWVITADETSRGGKKLYPLEQVRSALKQINRPVKTLIVNHPLKRTELDKIKQVQLNEGEVWFEEILQHIKEKTAHQTVSQRSFQTLAVMDSEDPLFMLYTSGSTAKPKGVLHTTAGYLAYASYTHELVFKPQPNSVYWCTADVGWITGHSYVVYGPLANGVTTVIFEGVPNYPSASRCWEIVDKLKVDVFYTAPTAIRALLKEGDEFVKKTSRASLRILGSVGEPINPEAWKWYFEVVGERRCPILDTWWQTETGGILLCPQPDLKPLKPGATQLPLPGIQPEIVDDKGQIILGPGTGALVLKASWPGQMRTVFGDHKRFEATYFETFPGRYFSGDRATRDQDGDIWINGRMDDVLNVSGHRIGTAELEGCINSLQSKEFVIAESAVVGYPHELKGEGIYAFVILKSQNQKIDEETSLRLENEIRSWVSQHLSPIAKPDKVLAVESLPKTRSGKIMRRILRKIATKQFEDLGDLSTLNDPDGVNRIIELVKD